MKMIFLWAIFGVVMISCNSSQKNNAPIKNREIKTESQAHTSNLSLIPQHYYKYNFLST